MAGSFSKGEVFGQLNAGELFASYNIGNVYTRGKQIELVKTAETVTQVYNVTAAEATIYTKGMARMENGTVYVAFDESTKALFGETPVVTVTPNGQCNGVYIESVDKNGFTLKELANGNATVNISWIAVATRIDNRMEEATRMVSAPDFEKNVQQVLFSDGNLDGSGMGMWWDGTQIQFGKIPAHLQPKPKAEGAK